MIRPKIWTNKDTRLFWCDFGGRISFMNYVTIDELKWEHGSREAAATIRCYLPQAEEFVYRCTVGWLDILRGECTDPSLYLGEQLILRLVSMRDVKKTMSETVIATREDVKKLSVILNATVDMLWICQL